MNASGARSNVMATILAKDAETSISNVSTRPIAVAATLEIPSMRREALFTDSS